jgi:hypothetical protein
MSKVKGGVNSSLLHMRERKWKRWPVLLLPGKNSGLERSSSIERTGKHKVDAMPRKER